MTINKLHKLLGKEIAAGNGRARVRVHKTSFSNALEFDGCVVLDVTDTECRWVPTMDDDGRMKVNADGAQSGRQCFILYGERIK